MRFSGAPEGCRGLRESPEGPRGAQGVSRGLQGAQGVSRELQGAQGVPRGLRDLGALWSYVGFGGSGRLQCAEKPLPASPLDLGVFRVSSVLGHLEC